MPLKCVYQFSIMMELDVGHMTVHTWGNGSNDKNSYSWFSWTVLIYVHCHSKKNRALFKKIYNICREMYALLLWSGETNWIRVIMAYIIGH